MSLLPPLPFLSRNDRFTFLLFLGFTQFVFILILYRRGAVGVFHGFFSSNKLQWDYSKTEDVYSNLSLFTPVLNSKNMPHCALISPILVGPIKVDFAAVPSIQTIVNKNPYVARGGRYVPVHCQTRYKSAIIVPLRHREQHLHYLLYYLHPFLQRQQIQYTIFVITQGGNATFNRAKLLNVGIKEALKEDDWDCLILQDVDLIPENDHNLYICDQNYPKHIASAMDKFHYRLPYWYYFGGVSALTPDQYMKINGFPNTYWGWGGEDDDIANRIQLAGMSITRTASNIGRYKMILHDRDEGNEENQKRYNMLKLTRRTWMQEGMNSLEYRLISKKEDLLYINITVDVGFPPIPTPKT